MILNSPYISGSLTVTGNEVVTGSLTVLGGITGAITGSATSASYAANASFLNGLGSEQFVPTGSFNTFSSSILTYTGSANSRLGSLETTSGSNITRISALEVASGSAITRLNSIETVTGSNITRLSSLEAKTGSYATTGSNTFDGGQYLSSSFNPTGFSTTASLYTDGGLRVTRDAYISGTLYLNNVTVFGTQSVAYISSSQLNIGTNLITVNTDTPSIRFGGLAVYDSGSTGLTGSLLWDSQNNHWVYSNPSGSNYSGGMFISGPRTSTLGSETGTTSCALMMGQGGDHITSSAVFHYGNATCFYGNSFISSSGAACFASSTQAGGFYANGSTTITSPFDTTRTKAYFDASNIDGATLTLVSDGTGRTIRLAATTAATYSVKIAINTGEMNIGTNVTLPFSIYTNQCSRATISSTGITSFACQICSPGAVFTGTARFSGGNTADVNNVAVRIDNWKSLSFYNCGETGWAFTFGADQSNNGSIGTNNDLIFNTSPTLITRARITSAGIACFSCQVCSPSFNSSASSTLNGLAVTCNVNSNCFTGVTVINGAGEGSEASRAGIAFQAYDWVQSAIWHGRNTASAFAGALVFGTNPNTANLTVGGVCTRLVINNEGIANFSCQVCSPYFVGGTILSTGTITANQGVITNISGLNIGGYNHYTQTVSGAMGILGHNVRADGSVANQVNVVNSSWLSSMIKLYYNDGITFHTSNTMYSAGAVYPIGDTERMRITGGGNVGIKTSNPTKDLHVCGGSAVIRIGPDYPSVGAGTDRDYIDLIADGAVTKIISPNEQFLISNPGGGASSYCIVMAAGSGGVVLTNGSTSWTSASDLRLKNINSEITNATAKLNTLRAVNFSWKSDETQRENLGLIAQDVAEVFPEVINYNPDVDEYGIRYTELIPVLVKGIQEQQTTICAQAGRIRLLESCLGIA